VARDVGPGLFEMSVEREPRCRVSMGGTEKVLSEEGGKVASLRQRRLRLGRPSGRVGSSATGRWRGKQKREKPLPSGVARESAFNYASRPVAGFHHVGGEAPGRAGGYVRVLRVILAPGVEGAREGGYYRWPGRSDRARQRGAQEIPVCRFKTGGTRRGKSSRVVTVAGRGTCASRRLRVCAGFQVGAQASHGRSSPHWSEEVAVDVAMGGVVGWGGIQQKGNP